MVVSSKSDLDASVKLASNGKSPHQIQTTDQIPNAFHVVFVSKVLPLVL
jgi:hypothetical protein